MRLLCLVGIWDFLGHQDPFWHKFIQCFQQNFPDWTCTVIHHTFHPWQIRQIHAYAQRTLDTYDDGIPTVLFGLSMGGLVAEHIAYQFKKTQIRGIVTVQAPLKLASWWKFQSKRYFQGDVLSLVGVFDPFVPWFVGSRKTQERRWIISSHFVMPILLPWVSQQIVHEMKQWMLKTQCPLI